MQCHEIRELVGVVEHLRNSNIRTAEQFERSKSRAESISCRMEETRASLHQLEAKAANKDFLIRTMVDLLLCQIEETQSRNFKSADKDDFQNQDRSPSYFVHRLRQTTVRPSKLRGCGLSGGKGGTLDFNLELLCSYIESEGRRRRNDKYGSEPSKTMQENTAKVNISLQL